MIINQLARALRNQNPTRARKRARHDNPSPLGVLTVLAVAGVGAFAAYKVLAKDDIAPASSCTVTFTQQSLNEPATKEIMIAWLFKWAARSSLPARDAAIDLMQQLAPQCTWIPTSNATIYRADGSTISWQQVLQQFGSRTVGDVDEDFIPTLFGTDPQSVIEPPTLVF